MLSCKVLPWCHGRAQRCVQEERCSLTLSRCSFHLVSDVAFSSAVAHSLRMTGSVRHTICELIGILILSLRSPYLKKSFYFVYFDLAEGSLFMRGMPIKTDDRPLWQKTCSQMDHEGVCSPPSASRSFNSVQHTLWQPLFPWWVEEKATYLFPVFTGSEMKNLWNVYRQEELTGSGWDEGVHAEPVLVLLSHQSKVTTLSS